MWTTNAAAPSYSRSIFYNAIGTSSSRDVTKLIKASAGTYTFKFNDLINNTTSASTPINIATFDNNGNFLSRSDGSEVITVTLEQDGYIDIRRSPNEGTFSFSSIQMNEGSTALPYEPYFEGKRLEFNVCNKNIFDNEWELGIIRGDTGVNQDNSSYIRSKNFIPVKELTNYKISDKNNIFNRMLVYEYKSDFSYNLTTNKNVYNYFTTEKDTAYIRIRPGVEMTDTSVKVQIEEGTTATSYEEHKEQMIPFPLADGQKLMEGDYLADDGVHHVRGQVVLDGTEEGWRPDNKSNLFGILVDNAKGNSSTTAIPNAQCNRLIANSLSYTRNHESTFTLYGGVGNVTVWFNDKDMTLADFKAWVGTHNLSVEYELAEETIEPYTPAQAEAYKKLKNAKSYNETTHIWQVTDGLPAKLDIVALKDF